MPHHPNGAHTWGKCFSSVKNKDEKPTAKLNKKKDRTSVHKANVMNIELARILSLMTLNFQTVNLQLRCVGWKH
jgi:hypothetical protein